MGARPADRLQRALDALLAKHPPLTENASEHGKAKERPAYSPRLIRDPQGNECSLEESRARWWLSSNGNRRVGKRMPSEPLIVDESDSADDNLPGCIAVNPDDLTHVTVFKDNTADMRELMRRAMSAKNPQKPASKNAGASLGKVEKTKKPFLEFDDENRTLSHIPTTLPTTASAVIAPVNVFDAGTVPLLDAVKALQRKLSLLQNSGGESTATVASCRLANGRLFFVERVFVSNAGAVAADDAASSIINFVAIDLSATASVGESEGETEKCLLRVSALKDAGDFVLIAREAAIVEAVHQRDALLVLSPPLFSIRYSASLLSSFPCT